MAQEGKKPIGKIILIVVVALIAIGAIGSMAGKGAKSEKAASSDSSATEQAEQDTEEQEPYTIAEEAEDRSDYYFKITGILTNNSNSDKDYIQVEYVLYDADGNQIGTALANTNNLKAGGTWKYEATSFKTPEEVASWERAEVTGF